MRVTETSFKSLRRLASKIIARVKLLKVSLTTTQSQLATIQGQAQNLNQRLNTLEGQTLDQRVSDLEAAVQALQGQ